MLETELEAEVLSEAVERKDALRERVFDEQEVGEAEGEMEVVKETDGDRVTVLDISLEAVGDGKTEAVGEEGTEADTVNDTTGETDERTEADTVKVTDGEMDVLRVIVAEEEGEAVALPYRP